MYVCITVTENLIYSGVIFAFGLKGKKKKFLMRVYRDVSVYIVVNVGKCENFRAVNSNKIAINVILPAFLWFNCLVLSFQV